MSLGKLNILEEVLEKEGHDELSEACRAIVGSDGTEMGIAKSIDEDAMKETMDTSKVNMKNKLEILFDFLKKNRTYNHSLQEKYHLSSVIAHNDVEDKILSLLYDIVNTQSQPKIDNISMFFKNISNNTGALKSFKNFVNYLNSNSDITPNFNELFQGLRRQPGWGNKTSALFVKSIFHFHNGKYSERLLTWNDVPKKINENDTFYLPVDAVIIAIFKKLDPLINWNFYTINLKIKEFYSSQEIEIWDDLWFWGFITQKGSGDKRSFKWNENKYWILKETSKDKNTIDDIKNKAETYLSIFGD
jgi:hypothetical protein